MNFGLVLNTVRVTAITRSERTGRISNKRLMCNFGTHKLAEEWIKLQKEMFPQRKYEYEITEERQIIDSYRLFAKLKRFYSTYKGLQLTEKQ